MDTSVAAVAVLVAAGFTVTVTTALPKLPLVIY